MRTSGHAPNLMYLAAGFVAAGIIAAGPSRCQSVHGVAQSFAVPCPAGAFELHDSVERLEAALLTYRTGDGPAFCPGFKDYRIRDRPGIFSARWNHGAACRVDVEYTYITATNAEPHDTERFGAGNDSLAELVAELIAGRPVSRLVDTRQSFKSSDQIGAWCGRAATMPSPP